MPQYARPESDTYRDNWETQAGATTGLYATIDETSADSADYVRSQLTPTSDVYVCKLSAVTDPLSSTGHVLRYTYGKDASGGDQIDQTVELRQDYSDEGSPGPGTLIKQIVHTDVGAFPQSGSTTLSAGEADSITDYGSLFFRVVGNKP